MSLVSADRVHETSQTTGTSAFVMLGAVSNFRTFASVMSVGDTCFYAAIDRGDAGWETGLGTRQANGSLARTAIVSSSIGGARVPFGGGIRDVVITLSPLQVTNIVSRSPAADALTGQEAIGGSQNGGDVKITLDTLTAFVAARVEATPGGGISPVDTLRPAGTLRLDDLFRLARPEEADPLDKDVRTTVGDIIALIPPSEVDPAALAAKLDTAQVGITVAPLSGGLIPDQYVRPALLTTAREGSDLVFGFSDGSTQRVSLASVPPVVAASPFNLEISGELLLEDGFPLLQEV